MRLVLASASAARRRILADAGLDFEVVPADVDECALRESMGAKNMPAAEIAAALAREKALGVGAHMPEALVVGADQVLVHEGRILEKAGTRHEAAQTLRALSGKTHSLISAACVAHNGAVLWHTTDRADLTMRAFDDDFLDSYLRAAGDDALTRHVGAYAIEGSGLWLFEKIEGDYFTILGIPALALLRFLTQKGFGP